MYPHLSVLSVLSSGRGGVDLASPSSAEWLRTNIHIKNPEDTVLIHAAAKVESNSLNGLLANAAMAFNVSKWANTVGIGFSVMVSSVSVYPPRQFADTDTPC